MATALDAKGERETPTVYVASLDSPDRTPLAQMHSRMVYAPPGYLLFVEEARCWRRHSTPRASSSAANRSGLPKVSRITERSATRASPCPSNGVLAYHGRGDDFQPRLARSARKRDRHGMGRAELRHDADLAVTANASPSTWSIRESAPADIWIYDVSRGTPIRFTTDPADESAPVWSPDGRRILFRSERSGAPNSVHRRHSRWHRRAGLPGRVTAECAAAEPDGLVGRWPMDRVHQQFSSDRSETCGCCRLPAIASRGPCRHPLRRIRRQFSPDSAWVAFVSNESGTPEVYVAPVRQPGDKRPISIGGGTTPRWRNDGRELYYASAGNRSIMAVADRPGPTIKAGTPTRLFSLGAELATRPNPRNTAYDVTPDGQRFLVSVPAGEPVSSRITVVQNWTAAHEEPVIRLRSNSASRSVRFAPRRRLRR